MKKDMKKGNPFGKRSAKGDKMRKGKKAPMFGKKSNMRR